MDTLGFAWPETIRLDNASGALVLEWPDGSVAALSVRTLREQCKCAACRASRDKGRPPVACDEIAIVNIVPYGANAVQLMFSDGHSRGIFPFAYLRALASGLAATTSSS
jgi:DUF971 family protein